MMLNAVLVFYSEKTEDASPQKPEPRIRQLPEKQSKLGMRILQMKYELANFPLGREYAAKADRRNQVVGEAYQLDLEPPVQTEFRKEPSPLEGRNPIVTPPPIKLKTECCEKYLKGKRCGRCPCFDLPDGPASRWN